VSGNFGESLYHYTRGPTAIAKILPSMNLMLGPFSTMRDPRESRDWLISPYPDIELPGTTDDQNNLLRELFLEFNKAKETFKVLSLTRDDTEHDLEDDLTDALAFGYGHPRLWEYYADDHTGVCLRLNRSRLLEAFEEQLGGKGFFTHGKVVYRDARGVDRLLLHLRMSRIDELGIAGAVRDHLKRHCDEFFFHKLGDWATEMEYRLILHIEHDGPEFLDISDCLETVLCGFRMPDDDVDRIIDLCEPRGIGVGRVWWANALPMVGAAKPKPGGLFVDAIIPIHGLPDDL
jgi:hypothetical protein